MKSREKAKNDNKKDYKKQGFKSQGQFAKNQIVQTTEKPKYNKSGVEAKNKYDFE
ncbi:hypothetical protein OW763_03055 [Clostridium aestuarii]|uniref:Glycogen biosynthesis protein GlgD n=1 Tax=Clostridium aestuarii TaxID=338193 RepID=A0ABT4CYY5_9CLOT|nr:hypothetical protein [Clostridium aestuarii]MCY6483335.1 hypothetical protein [Clostridium aestuarii]